MRTRLTPLLLPIVAVICIAASGDVSTEPIQTGSKIAARDGISALDRLLMAEGTVIIGNEKMEQRQEYLRRFCRDRLEQAKDGAPSLRILDRPLFQRRPDTPENPPLAIYAVDRRENGCGMMVMMGNPDDVRPVPSLDADDHRLMPADDPEN